MKFKLDPLSASGASVVPPIAPVITGVSATSGAGAVDSVNSKTGVVVLNAEDVLPSETGNSGKFLTTNGSVSSWGTPGGGGDMLKATYDPNAVNGDAFAMDNMRQGLTNFYITAAEKTVLDNTSGVNTGDQTSVSGNAGTATKLVTARNIDGQSFDGSANITVIAPATHAATGKTTPVDADELPLVDSAASNVLKKLTWANLKATLKTYFDTLYQAVGAYITASSTDTLTNKDLTSGTNTFPTLNQNTTGSAAKWTTARNLAGNSVDGSANVAFANKFIVQGTVDSGLSAAQFLGALSSGIVKVTTTTGVLTSVAAPTGAIVGDTDTQSLTNKTFDSTSPTAFFQPGFVLPCGLRTAPTGWLMCDGSAVSRATYSGLFAAVCEAVGTFTVTLATPGVVTLTAHGLVTGDQVFLTNSGGALPTGLTANTLYYAVKVDANTLNLATSRANAYAGTKIATSGSQSGTHTLRWCPYGLGDGSTTFTLPDFRGRTIAGADAMGGTAASRLTLADALGSYGNIGASGGEQRHTQTLGELATHTHASLGSANGTTGGNFTAHVLNANSAQNLTSAGSSTPFNLISPTAVSNYIIKT